MELCASFANIKCTLHTVRNTERTFFRWPFSGGSPHSSIKPTSKTHWRKKVMLIIHLLRNFSYLSSVWFSVHVIDLWDLEDNQMSHYCATKFEEKWLEEAKKPKPSLANTFFRTFGFVYTLSAILLFFQILLGFVKFVLSAPVIIILIKGFVSSVRLCSVTF